MSLKIPVVFLSFLFGMQLLTAAPSKQGPFSISLTPTGVLIENGYDTGLTLSYPLPSGDDRKDNKVAAATVKGNTAVVTYVGGGQLAVRLDAGALTYDLAGLPAGTKHLHSVLPIGPEYGGSGKWRVGAGEPTAFPFAKPASPFLHKGGGSEFSLFGLNGTETAVRIPVLCYQQINDNREWGQELFQWHVWMPIAPGTPTLTLQIELIAPNATAKPASAATAAPASATAASASTTLKATGNPSLKTAFTPVDEALAAGTRVMKWKDGKRGVFMIQFDDSAASQIRNVIPELVKRGIPGTFYINPGNGPYKSQQAAWEKAATLPGIELANHTFTHIGGLTVEAFEEELVKCTEVLNQLYPTRKTPRLISFGRPGVPKEKWGITDAQIKEVLARNHLIERPPFAGPPFQYKTIPEMNQLVDSAIQSGEMKTLVFHGVGGDWLVTPLDYFAAVLNKLDANRDQLWLTDPLAYHKYLTERTTAVANEISSTASRIQVSLTSQADAAFYDQPLSLATRVPAAWKQAIVQQGASRTTVPVVAGIARYDALPNAGEITLTP